MPSIPLPVDGVVGRLTPIQSQKLKETWNESFRLTAEAPRVGSGVVEKAEPAGASPKVRSLRFARDRISLTPERQNDAEKQAYNEAIETAATKAALSQCLYFLETGNGDSRLPGMNSVADFDFG